ncbi:MAG: hypothetical protein AMXMBFR56_62260 [Polyangiaceae bacterium]
MFTVTLVYGISVGIQLAANYVTAVQNIDVFEPAPPGQGILAMLGMDLVSDTTVAAGLNAITRTIVLQTNAQGDALYADADAVKDATRNIFRSALSVKLPGQVVAAEPVVV